MVLQGELKRFMHFSLGRCGCPAFLFPLLHGPAHFQLNRRVFPDVVELGVHLTRVVHELGIERFVMAPVAAEVAKVTPAIDPPSGSPLQRVSQNIYHAGIVVAA
jgi:hypothetical protein